MRRTPTGGRNRSSVPPTRKCTNHRSSRPKERNKLLAVRYSELLRLREMVLEAEHNRHFRDEKLPL